jgi:3-methyladenine DNA glycosylase AlkC
MDAQSNEPGVHPYSDADYAAIARDVRYLKAAVAMIAEQIARRHPAIPSSQASDTGEDEEERAILAHLADTVSPSEQAQARAALNALANLAHEVSAANGLTEDELADRFDAARRTASLSR